MFVCPEGHEMILEAYRFNFKNVNSDSLVI